MNETTLINEWLKFKETRFNRAALGFQRLEAAMTIEHTYRSDRYGDPSSFAGVRFLCSPAQELSFSSGAAWPDGLEAGEIANVERAIGNGLVEELLSRSVSAYRGCSVVLDQILWDNVGSSETAFYRAAREAMQELIAKGQWQ